MGEISLEKRLEMFNKIKGKQYIQGEIINIEMIDIEGTVKNLNFDISNCILSIDDVNFKLELPSGAILTKIAFEENRIILSGKISFFSGSGETDYKSFLNFIDDALEDGIAHLSTNSGVTKLTKIE